MLISKEWLSEYVALPAEISAAELAFRFSLATAEIEGVVDAGAAFENIVVGVIESVGPHPGADKLRICKVDVGMDTPVQIVCGGSNLVPEQKVVVALPGARVRWHGEGNLVTLEKTKIRGEESIGMICGADEVGLSSEFPSSGEKEIVDCSSWNVPAGTPLAEALGRTGVVFEIDNKSLSNRPDLWGHIGVAREFAALLKTFTMLPQPPVLAAGDSIYLDVTVADSVRVPRYTAAVVTGVAALPAADFIQKRLTACGVACVNAIVDTLNYVMLETGQPMHAFDYDNVKNADGSVTLEVRPHGSDGKFTTFAGTQIAPAADALMITNPAGPLVVAGIIGGAASGVNAQTHTVVLESAVFNAQQIRRTSNALGIRTESSTRFEKGLDPAGASFALARAIELLQKQFPNLQVASNLVDLQTTAAHERVLSVSEEYIHNMLGISLPTEVVLHILNSLGFGVAHEGTAYIITVPSFRAKDIVGPEDIVEELVRLYGYEHIPARLPHITGRVIEPNGADILGKKIKLHTALASRFHEINCYAFIRGESAAALGLQSENLLQLANPLSTERPFITPMLKINLMESASAAEHTRDTVALFEIARVFAPHTAAPFIGGEVAKSIPMQPLHAGFIFADRAQKNSFGVLRDVIFAAAHSAGYTLTLRTPDAPYNWHKKQVSANIFCGTQHVGSIGAANSRTARAFGFVYETIVAEIDLELLAACPATPRVLAEVNNFPMSVRDIACVVDEKIKYEQLAAAARTAAPEVVLVEAVDLYRSATTVGENKKSIAIRVGYQSETHTLTSEEIETAHAKVLGALQTNVQAQIR